jgi:hypothetical protein
VILLNPFSRADQGYFSKLKLKSGSKYNHFMGRYSDTNVEKSAILSLKIEQNGGFLEI